MCYITRAAASTKLAFACIYTPLFNETYAWSQRSSFSTGSERCRKDEVMMSRNEQYALANRDVISTKSLTHVRKINLRYACVRLLRGHRGIFPGVTRRRNTRTHETCDTSDPSFEATERLGLPYLRKASTCTCDTKLCIPAQRALTGSTCSQHGPVAPKLPRVLALPRRRDFVRMTRQTTNPRRVRSYLCARGARAPSWTKRTVRWLN